MGVLTFVAVLALVVAAVHGQPDPGHGFSARLNRAISVTKSNIWTTLKGYRTTSDKMYFSRPGWNSATGVYTAPVSGVYMISSQVSISQGNINYFRLLVSINGGYNLHNTMHAIKANAKWYTYSMNVNGFLYLSEGDYIAANVYSRSDSTFSIGTTSSFSAMFMGPVYQHIGFSADLWGSRRYTRNGWSEITGWSNTAYTYLWNNGQSFNTGNGRFTAPCNGVYYVAANIRMDSAQGGYFRLIAAVNGSANANAGLASIEGNPTAPYYTQNIGGAVELNKGDYISLWMFSSSDRLFYAQSESSFHVMYIGPKSNIAPAFLADFNAAVTISTIAERRLTGFRVSGAPGLYATGGFSTSRGILTVPFSGMYSVTLMVRFNNAKGNTEAYIYPGTSTVSRYLAYASRSWTTRTAMDAFTLKVSAVVYLNAGDSVSGYTKCQVRSCQIGSESSISGAFLGPNLPHPGVHADIGRDIRVTGAGWKKANNWNVNYAANTGLYATDSSWDGTQYVAAAPGIYYVACNLRLDYATKSPLTRATIAVNDKFDVAHGLHGVDSSSAAFVTFNIAGFVKLQSGDSVSLYSFSSDTSYTQSTMSGFSVNRMGSAFDTPSFLADLSADMPMVAGKYTQLTKWNAQAGYGTFKTSFNFDEPSGVFTAPYAGKYIVTANIRFDGAKPSAYYRVIICTGDATKCTPATAGAALNNGLHSIRGTLATPPPSFSESVQGVVPLQAGQIATVFVFGSKGPYTVNSESGFSICFVPGNPYGFNGDLGGSYNLAPTARSTWRELKKSWRLSPGSSPSLWNYGFSQNLGSMTVPKDGTGVYVVAANIRFDRALGNNFRLLIAINDVSTTANGLSSMQGTPVNTYFTLQACGSVFLKGGQRISIWVYNTKTTQNFLLQTESGFSAVLVSGTLYSRPSFLADVPATINVGVTGWYKVPKYITHSTQSWTWGLHKFGNGTLKNGDYIVPQTGIYWVMANLRLNAAGGRYTRLVIAVNNKPSLDGGLHSITGPPSASYYTLHTSGAVSVNQGNILSMYVYSNSDPSYQIDTESTFSIFYLGAPKQIPGFNIDMSTNANGLRTGVSTPRGFRFTGVAGIWSSTAYRMGTLDTKTGTFTIPQAGVYLISISFRLDGAGFGYFRTMVSLNGSRSTTTPALSAIKSGSLHRSYQTTNVFGALQLEKGSTIAPITLSTTDTSWSFQHESGWSAVYIGAMNQVQGASAKRIGTSTITRARQWYEIWSWDTSGPGFFGDNYFSLRTGRYTTQASGKFYVSVNIRFDGVDSGYIYSKILINRNLAGRARLTALMGNMVTNGAPNTLSMSGVLYLPQFAQISIGIYSSTDSNYMLHGDSTYTVLYLGTNDNPECMKGGPVFAVDPLATQVLVGAPLGLTCRALSFPPPVYSWYLNGVLLPGQNTTSVTLTASNAHQGLFQCRARANGRTISSATAAVTVFGHDGTVPGFAGDILFSQNVRLQARWVTVSWWRTASALQTNLYDTGNFNERTGVFTVPLSGVYIVALNLRLDSISGDNMQAVISINNGNGINNGMSAIQGFPTLFQTINVNAAIYLKKRQTLRVKAYSQSDNNWNIQGESGFSARYLAPLQTVPGTMWELGADIQRGKNGWFEVTGWRAIWGQTVGTGSYNTDGRFSAPCDGIYYVASNIRVENANGAYFRSLVAINGRTDVSNGLHNIQGSPKTNYFTMTVVGVVQLTKGQNLSALIYSYNDPSYTIDTASSMSIAYLSPASNAVPGFHADLLADVRSTVTNAWVTVKGWRVKGSNGLFKSGTDFNENNGYFTASTAGVYHVSALLRMDSSSGRYFRAAISIDNQPSLHNGLHSIRGYAPGNYYTLTVAGTVPLQAGQNISVVVYSNTDKSWRVQHESGFSVYLLERISPGFHAELQTSNAIGNTAWNKISKWRTTPGKNDGLFQTGSLFNPITGYYTVNAPGVYYVAANLRFDSISTGQVGMSIVVNDDTTINNGLYVQDTYLPQKNQQFSLRSSGFIHLRLGDTVSVYIKSSKDNKFMVQHESGFSLAYVAPPLSIPAMLADYNQNVKYTKTGWFELNRAWNVDGRDSLFISGGQAFNRNNGRFTAPAPGTYWVAANVMLTGLDATNGALHAAIGVNGVYNTTSGLHAMRSSSPSPSQQFTLMVSGALQLNTGDYLSVWVGSDVDANWGVSSRTGFSAAFIGTKLLQGFSSWGPPIKRTKTGWIRQTGFQTTGFPGLFNTFGADPFNGLWTVPQSGWYYIAANHHITGGSGLMRTLVGISLSLTPNNGLHSAQGNPTTDMSPSLAGIARLRKGQTLSNHFYSATDTSYTFSTQGFSAVEIGDYHKLPSFHAYRGGINVNQAGWYTLVGFNTNTYSWTYDQQTGAFINGAGIFIAPTDGIYWVSGSVDMSGATGTYFRLVVSVNGANSVQGGLHSVTGPPTSNRYTLTVSGSMYMRTGDRASLAVFSANDLSYRINRAQFAMHFLEYTLSGLGFNVDQAANTRGGKLAWSNPSAWTVSGSNGLYVNGTGLDTKTGIYTVPYTGIYLVALNMRVDGANTGYFRVKVAINGSDTKDYGMTVSKTGATHGSYYTLNLVNALYLYKGSKLQPRGWSNADTNWWYQQESGWNAVYLASRTEVPAVHAKLASNVTMTRSGRIAGWTTNSRAAPFMGEDNFDEGAGIFTARVAGNYFCSFNIRVDGVSTGPLNIQLRVNNGQAALQTYEGLPVSATNQLSINTLSASGIVQLKRFQKLSVWVSNVVDTSFRVVDESSMSIVLVGGTYPERCPLTGVSILQQPQGGLAAAGSSFNFTCLGEANGAITYNWYKNGRYITGATSMFYSIPMVTSASQAWYRCDVVSGSDTARGIGTYLSVYNPFPVFRPATYDTSVYENIPKGNTILKVIATAQMSNKQVQAVSYSIVQGAFNSFVVNANTGVITRGNRNINYEAVPLYSLVVRATNKAVKTAYTDVRINVTILDLNDNRPVFKPRTQTVSVSESYPVGATVAVLTVTDADTGTNADVAFNITGGNGRNFFGVSGNKVIVANPLDRDYTTRLVSIRLFFKAFNPTVTGPNGFGTVTVKILDVNDNLPIFRQPVYNLNVSEAIWQNAWIARVYATDKDYGTNGTLSYSILSGNSLGHFQLNSLNGVLRLANTLDYDIPPTFYTLTVQALDGGTPAHSTQVLVNIQVENANDNVPLFTLPQYIGMTTENLPAGQSVVTVLATEKDTTMFTYSVSSSKFAINQTSGVITTTGPLDREAGTPFVFTVSAVDVVPANMTAHTGTAMVSIDIIDVNDNTPAFTAKSYPFSIPETISVGAVIGTVTANDPDDTSFGTVTYTLASTLAPFYIQPATGIIETTTTLDYQKQKSFAFTVTATDGGGLSSTAVVTVAIQNVNLHAPVFANTTYYASVNENAPNGTVVTTVKATDIDQVTGLTYAILHGSDGRFAVNAATGVITVSGALVYEDQPGYELVVACNDNGVPAMQNITFVYVSLVDLNDNAPVFAPPRDSAGISRLAPAGTLIYTARATDADAGTNAMVRYTLSGPQASLFNISATNGTIFLGAALAQFTGTSISVVVGAADMGIPTMYGSLQLTDNVLPASGDTPQFALDVFKTYVKEDVIAGTPVISALAFVADLANSGDISYSIAANPAFGIDKTTGSVYTTNTLDRESMPSYDLKVTASVGEGLNSISSDGRVLITLLDANDNAPMFSNSTMSGRVSELDHAGTPVFQLVATDLDQGSNAIIRYSIVTGGDGVFSIDPYLGTIYTTQKLNPKVRNTYVMTVAATNPTLFPLTTTGQLTITVVDENDNNPMFNHPWYHFYVLESAAGGAAVGQLIATDVDTGAFGTFSFSLVKNANSPFFQIDATSGALSLALTTTLDREKKGTYSFQAKVTDGGGLSDWARVLVYIDDVNDNAPVMQPNAYFVSLSQGIPQGTGVVAIRATDRDTGRNGAAGFTYKITGGDSAGRFSCDQQSGIVTVAHPLNAVPNTNYLLTVQVTDGGIPAMSATGTVNITAYPASAVAPVFTYPSYTVSVNSPQAKGTTLLRVQATGNGSLTYRRATTSVPFNVDWKNGTITLASDINSDTSINSWIFTVSARDRLGLTGYATVHVNFLHRNEYSPVFSPLNQLKSVSEGANSGTSIVQMRATDRDDGSDGVVSYSILGGTGFDIDATTGWVTVDPLTTLDRETRPTYTLVVLASDGGTPPLTATSTLVLTVTDINDNTPVFSQMVYNASVGENLAAGSYVATVIATDADIGTNANVTYSLSRIGPLFTVDTFTGVVSTKVPLDREDTDSFVLTVKATDGLNNAVPCEVDIHVLDANDHGPVFGASIYSGQVNYNAPIGTTITIVSASDKDIGSNAIAQYKLGPTILDGYLNVSDKGEVYVLESPIPAEQAEFTIPLYAIDSRNSSLVANASFMLTLLGLPEIVAPAAQTGNGNSLSGGVVAGIAIACILGTLLVVMLIVVILRRGQPRHEPFAGDEGVKYETDTGHLAGVGVSNPMYTSGGAAAIENPMYATTGGGGQIQEDDPPAKYGL